MLGLFRKRSAPDTLYTWLHRVDKEYATAVHSKQPNIIGGYLSRDCFNSLLTYIKSNDEVYSGIDRYKHVEFKEISRTTNQASLLKEVTYDHIQIRKGIRARVGDDYKEVWEVALQPRREVLSIRRVRDN